ncbi:MAG: MraY family glycosyltransferase [Parvibaculales bacterium]
MFNTLINNIPYGVYAGFLTLVLALGLQPLARRVGLLDAPGGRKKHAGNIPLIGGICLYITFAVTFFLASETIPELQWLIISTSLLMLVGIIDDFFDIRALYKLIAQSCAAGLMVWGTDIHIGTIAYFPDGSPLSLGDFGYIVTIIAVVGLVNAFNMSDGIDGLAGMQALLSTLAIGAIISSMGRELVHEPYLDVFRGAIGGYLLVNLAIVSRRKVFLGDAGSMMIGFICAWIAIYYAQLPPEKALPPSLALWIFAVPVMDTLTVIFIRLLNKRAIFKADQEHLHHLLFHLTQNHKQTLAIIILMTIAMVVVGFSLFYFFGDIGAIVGFVLAYAAYLLLINKTKTRIISAEQE